MENKPDKNWTWTVNTLLRLSVILLIAITAYQILSPLISLLVWGLILAISLTPLHQRLSTLLKNRSTLAAILITVFFLLIVLGPFSYVINSLAGSLKDLRTAFHPEHLDLGQIAKAVEEWPLVGERLHQEISDFASHRADFLQEYRSQILSTGTFIVGLIKGAAGVVALFFGAILVAGAILAFSNQRRALGVAMGYRLAGDYGAELAGLIEKTVRSVVGGVLGVALIQSALAGLGFFIIGIPYAGFWTLATLFLALVQIGAGPTAIGAVIYAFYNEDTLPAVLFLVWNIVVMLSDNVLKPVLMGRGLGIPMLIILIGAIGGMLSHGILGLFLGPVVLAVGYKLFSIWLKVDTIPNHVLKHE